MPRKKISARAIALAILLACVVWTGECNADCNDPVECLDKIAGAVENADADTFSQYVDVDAVLQASLEAFLQEAKKPGNASQIPPMLAIIMSQASGSGAAAQKMKSLLLNEAKAFVLNGISSGAFAGRKLDRSQLNGLLAPLFAEASTGRKQIHHIGEAEMSGDGWLVPFWVLDMGNGQEYPVTARFAPAENGWRMTRVENIEQLIKQIQAEARGVN